MKTGSATKEMKITAARPKGSDGLDALFDAHILREFADRDVQATMETMVAEPYVTAFPS